MTGRSEAAGHRRRNVLVFFSAAHSGPARRMESLLAHLERKERHRLSVKRVDVDQEPELAKRFEVRSVPTLILVKGKRAVARLEGQGGRERGAGRPAPRRRRRNRPRRTTVMPYTNLTGGEACASSQLWFRCSL